MISSLKYKLFNHPFFDNVLEKSSLLLFEIRIQCFTGSMIPNNMSSLHLLAFHIHRIFVLLICLSLIVAIIADMYFAGGNFIVLGEDICTSISFVFVFSKYLIILLNCTELGQISKRIINLGAKNHRKDTGKVYYLIRKKYIIAITGITVLFHMLSVVLLAAMVLSAENGRLPLRAYYPMDLNGKYAFALFYGHQILGLFYTLNSIVASDSTCGILWFLIGLEFEVLSREFQNMETHCCNEVNKGYDLISATKNRLKQLIKRHQYIIELTKQLNAITSPQLSAQIYGSNFMICLSGFIATLTLHNKPVCFRFVIHFGSAMFQLLFWCIHGEIIYSKSTALANSAFYNLNFITDKSIITDLKIVIARSQRVIFIKAGRINKFNLETFLTVLSGSYSYFALLRTLNESN